MTRHGGQARRRDGFITIKQGGTLIPGPFTLQARAEILERLRAVEETIGQTLISEEEVELIHTIWAQEIAAQVSVPSICVREIKKGK